MGFTGLSCALRFLRVEGYVTAWDCEFSGLHKYVG